MGQGGLEQQDLPYLLVQQFHRQAADGCRTLLLRGQGYIYSMLTPHLGGGGGGGKIMENFSSKVLIKKSRKGGEKDREKL